MEYELKKLKMLAFGNQAEIYEIDEKKVLRVLKRPEDEPLLKAEIEAAKALRASGVDVPQAYEYLTVEGRPALLAERINGSSMMESVFKSPLKAVSAIKRLAELHCEVLGRKEVDGLAGMKRRSAWLTENSELLGEKEKEFVMSLIDGVPEDDRLCHGDFHLGNILISGKRQCIIDWFGAYSGSAVSDIANTYMLFKSVPKVPGMAALRLSLLKAAGRLAAGCYLKAVRKRLDFSDEEFSKWLVIKAAERSFCGVPEEREGRARFVSRCMEDREEWRKWRGYL